jgi:antitoxin component YwqK of YwqJK toxin-antitoxin module
MDRLTNLPTAIFTGEVLCNLNLTEVSELRAVNRTMKETISLNREYILKVCFHVLPHGLVQERTEAGWIQQISTFKEGKLHGVQRVFYSNDQLRSESHYADGIKQGEEKRWFDNGCLRLKQGFISGIGQGQCEYWYRNGQRAGLKQLNNGELHGLQKEYYYPNGAIMMETHYDQDEAHGRHVRYYENGQIKEVGDYRRNQKVGEWTSYLANGQELRKHCMQQPERPWWL